MKNPKILRGILSKENFKKIQSHVIDLDKSTLDFSSDFSRYEFGNTDVLDEIHDVLLPIAKSFFETNTLIKSFNFGAWYFGDASLEKHRDVSACTYSINLCVYQQTPWDLYIEDTAYTLNENDAVLYYGEDQKHWREEFPSAGSNIVCNVFFFYVEPDHWFITEPLERHQAIRQQKAVERNLL